MLFDKFPTKSCVKIYYTGGKLYSENKTAKTALKNFVTLDLTLTLQVIYYIRWRPILLMPKGRFFFIYLILMCKHFACQSIVYEIYPSWSSPFLMLSTLNILLISSLWFRSTSIQPDILYTTFMSVVSMYLFCLLCVLLCYIKDSAFNFDSYPRLILMINDIRGVLKKFGEFSN